MTSTWVCCLSSVALRRILYTFINMCHFDYTSFAVIGKVWMPKTAVASSNDRPKSVRNRCVIKVFDCVVV